MLLILLGLLFQDSTPTNLETLDFQADRIPWRQLNMEASRWFVRAETTLKHASVTELPESLPEANRGQAWSSDGPWLQFTTKTDLLGTESSVDVFMEASGRTVLGVKLNRGRKNYRKVYRYMLDGVFTHRLAPLKRSEKRRPETWSDAFESFDARPVEMPMWRSAAALIHTLSGSSLNGVGDRASWLAYTGKDWLRLEAAVVRMTSERRRYKINGVKANKSEMERLLEISLSGVPIGDASSEFELLGLEGDIRLFMTPQTRLPVKITGQVKVIGDLEIRLKEAWLSDEDN